jgi:hypothetical protein
MFVPEMLCCYRDPNRYRDRNRRESKEIDPDSDFDFDCTDVP